MRTTGLRTRPSDPPESTCSPAWPGAWPCRERDEVESTVILEKNTDI